MRTQEIKNANNSVIDQKINIEDLLLSHELNKNNPEMSAKFSFYLCDENRYLIQFNFTSKIYSQSAQSEMFILVKDYKKATDILSGNELFNFIEHLFIFAAAEQLKGNLLGGIN